MPKADRPLRVFLCHSSNDKPVVRDLYRRLDAEGWMDVWLDESKLFPGQDWSFEIEKAVEEADVILVCLTKNSVNKEGYVQRELRIVLDLADYKPEGTLFVIPVRLEECDPPRRLRSWQYADYFPEENRDTAYQRLLVSLKIRADKLGIVTSTTLPTVSAPVQPVIKTEQSVTGKDMAQKQEVIEEIVKSAGGMEKLPQAFDLKGFLSKFSPRLAGVTVGGFLLILLVAWGISSLENNQFPSANEPTQTLSSSPTFTQSLPISIATTEALPKTQSLPTITPTVSPTPGPTLGIGSTMISPKDGMVVVYVPAGEFTMGSDADDAPADQEPPHLVNLDAFWIDQTEVTNAMYEMCVDEKQCIPPERTMSNSRVYYFGDPDYATYPVINIDWDMARTYCEWAGRRLPTEAEWEKAARGADGRTYPWGNKPPSMLFLNYRSSDTTEVGSYPDGKSIYGALDMAGNVWEWVSSLYKSYPYNATDGREDLNASGERVMRGGSWYFIWGHRSADRYYGRIDWVDDRFGFRCAISASE